MRQLHVKEPWAGLVQSNDREIITDLLTRIQILEHRMRELEELVRAQMVSEIPEQEALPIS